MDMLESESHSDYGYHTASQLGTSGSLCSWGLWSGWEKKLGVKGGEEEGKKRKGRKER